MGDDFRTRSPALVQLSDSKGLSTAQTWARPNGRPVAPWATSLRCSRSLPVRVGHAQRTSTWLAASTVREHALGRSRRRPFYRCRPHCWSPHA